MTNTFSSVELSHKHALLERGSLAVPALLFIASIVATATWCNATSAISKIPMAWMLICSQIWWSFTVSFIGMWVVMIVTMILSSLPPTLRQYHGALHLVGKPNVDTQTALVGAGYFTVWALTDVMVFALGTALAQPEITQPVMTHVAPFAKDTVVLAVGVLQSNT